MEELILKEILEEIKGMRSDIKSYQEQAKVTEKNFNYELRRIATRIEELNK